MMMMYYLNTFNCILVKTNYYICVCLKVQSINHGNYMELYPRISYIIYHNLDNYKAFHQGINVISYSKLRNKRKYSRITVYCIFVYFVTLSDRLCYFCGEVYFRLHRFLSRSLKISSKFSLFIKITHSFTLIRCCCK